MRDTRRQARTLGLVLAVALSLVAVSCSGSPGSTPGSGILPTHAELFGLQPSGTGCNTLAEMALGAKFTPSSIGGCQNLAAPGPDPWAGAIPVDPAWFPTGAKVKLVLKQFFIANQTPGRQVIVCPKLIRFTKDPVFPHGPIVDLTTNGDYRFTTATCTENFNRVGTFYGDITTEAVPLEPGGLYVLSFEAHEFCESGLACPTPEPPGQQLGSYGAVVAQIDW